jgi:hypothetical protein
VGAGLHAPHGDHGGRQGTHRPGGRPDPRGGRGEGDSGGGVPGRERRRLGPVVDLVVGEPLLGRGRGRSASCLPSPLETSCASAMAAAPAAAAVRPRHPPAAAITTAAPHHSFVLSAASSTADSTLPTVGGMREAACRVSTRSASRSPASTLMSHRYPAPARPHHDQPSVQAGQGWSRRRTSSSSHFLVSRGWV